MVDSIRPLVGARIGVSVLIAQIAQILFPSFIEDLRQRRRFVADRQGSIAIIYGHFIPIANARLIGVRNVDCAVREQSLLGMRIVHHGNPTLAAVVVIVPQTERVADFMRGELADAGKGGLIEDLRLLVARCIRRQQAFENHVILTVSQ